MSRLLRYSSVALIILLTAAYFVLGHYAEKKEKFSTPTSFSRSATGISVFSELIARTSPADSVRVKQSPILNITEIEPQSFYFIFGPTSPISPREASILFEFVKKGGTLFLSFQNEATHQNLKRLLTELGMPQSIRPNSRFTNQEINRISPVEDSDFFEKGKKYGMYSPFIIEGPSCDDIGFACYVVTREIEAGFVVLMAGLPLIGNGLIAEDGNFRLATKLAAIPTRFYFDEYHHYFSDKSFSDLLFIPSVILPLLGILACAILFFAFGRSRKIEGSKNRAKAATFHDFNHSILLNLMARPSLREEIIHQHSEFLQRLAPAEKSDESGENGWLIKARKLLERHQTYLIKKGFKPK